MSEVLVLVDHVDGKVTKPTTELLTIARRLGEPSAVLIGGDAGTAAETLTKFGAEKIYVVDDADVKDYLVAPKAEVLAQLVEKLGADVRRPRCCSSPAARARRSPAAWPSRSTPA